MSNFDSILVHAEEWDLSLRLATKSDCEDFHRLPLSVNFYINTP
jgi:hypothetical protein